MNRQTEALKLALEALEECRRDPRLKYEHPYYDKTITAIREALAEQPAQQEIEELTAQRDKLADILTRTANALKGQPAELSAHSWHDLPEVAQQIKAAQQQQEPVAVYVGETWCGSVVRLYEDLPLETPLYTSSQPSNPLTDEQINLFINGRGEEGDDDYVEPTGDGFGLTDADLVQLVRRVETAHGIKEQP